MMIGTRTLKHQLLQNDDPSPLFSIIIPCYNVERYLQRTMDSILNQVYSNFEIIAVNDGSTDTTLKLLQEIVQREPRVRIINQTNAGVSVARNVGLANAIGTYVCFFDGDDLMPQGTLQYCADIVANRPLVDLLCLGYIAQNTATDSIRQYVCQQLDKCELDSEQGLRLFLRRKLYIHIGSFFCRRSQIMLDKIQFLPGCKIGEDIRYILQMLQNVHKIYYSSRVSFVYQIHNDTVMCGYRQVNLGHCEIFKAYQLDMSQFRHIQCDYNLFFFFFYISLFIRYLRYSQPNIAVEKQLLHYKYLLNSSVKFLSIQGLLIKCVKILPINKMFEVKHFIHRDKPNAVL